MKISLLGAGNVAWNLGHALSNAGHHIQSVIGRNENKVTQLARELAAQPSFDLQCLDDNAQVLIICVKDDAISDVANQIRITDKIVVHTSGFRSSNALSVCTENYGVFYPLQTMKAGLVLDFKTVPMLVEGSNNSTSEALYTLASSISDSVTTVTELQRKYIHLAAVFANNFTNHMWELSEQILNEQHIDFNILRPLIAKTAENIKSNSPGTVQTGPAVRNDFFTIEEHLKLLTDETQMTQVYKVITESILRNRS